MFGEAESLHLTHRASVGECTLSCPVLWGPAPADEREPLGAQEAWALGSDCRVLPLLDLGPSLQLCAPSPAKVFPSLWGGGGCLVQNLEWRRRAKWELLRAQAEGHPGTSREASGPDLPPKASSLGPPGPRSRQASALGCVAALHPFSWDLWPVFAAPAVGGVQAPAGPRVLLLSQHVNAESGVPAFSLLPGHPPSSSQPVKGPHKVPGVETAGGGSIWVLEQVLGPGPFGTIAAVQRPGLTGEGRREAAASTGGTGVAAPSDPTTLRIKRAQTDDAPH